MSVKTKRVYEFGPFRLDGSQKLLFERGEPVPLPPKVLDTLLVLVENGGQLVEKDELIKRVWPDTFVEENNLNKNISALRKALGEGHGESAKYIETVPKRGYRFVARVSEVAAAEEEERAAGAAPTVKRCPACQRIYSSTLKFCREDGTALVEAPAQATPQTAGLPSVAKQSADISAPILRASTPSIAVLPFVNMSADAENEYFCDGLAEELLNSLAKIETLRVAARTSAFSFKGGEAGIDEIGRKLNVGTVLEGSVRKAGNRLRITAQLINVGDGYHLWSERYDRQMEDIFDIQDEISLAIVDALKLKLLGEQKGSLLKRYTEDTEAYELYLKGCYHAQQFTLEGFDKAIGCFNAAIEKDPGYALAYSGIANAYYHAIGIHLDPLEAYPKMKEAAEKALALDDTLAEAHAMMAIVRANWDREWVRFEAGFKRAVELAPNDALIHQWYGFHLMPTARFEESLARLKLARRLDPLSLSIHVFLAWVYSFARRPEKVKEVSLKALEMNEDFWMAHWTMALGYELEGRFAEALAEVRKMSALYDSAWADVYLARMNARLGEREEVRKILDRLAERSKREWVSPYVIATVYVILGDMDRAVEWLQQAFESHDEGVALLKVDPALDPFRTDPRYADLLEKMNLAD